MRILLTPSRQDLYRPSQVIFLTVGIFFGTLLPFLPASAATLPSVPQYVEAMAGQTQVAVTWDVPSSNGGESLTYTARVWTIPPPTTSPVFASCTTTGLGCVITGLATGTSYYVDVIATNSAGSSGPSAMRTVSPGAAGSPPTNVSATSDAQGRVTITWSPPTNFGTGQFAWYAAEVFTSPEISAGAYKFYCNADPVSARSCLVVGLKLGTTYYVQVRTVSSLGSSYPSTPRFSVIAGSASTANPSATKSPTSSASPTSSKSPTASSTAKLPPPQLVKAVLRGKSVQVSWKAPVAVAGKIISWYTVGEFYANGSLIATCKTKPNIFTCSVPIKDAKGSVRIEVYAAYGVGVLSGAKAVIVKIPN